jgi:hypothetical protein
MEDFEETIEHIFLSCLFLLKLFSTLSFYLYNIPPHTNSKNMFRKCLDGIDKMTKSRDTNWSLLYVGLYRNVKIILLLEKLELQFFCRLFLRIHTDSKHGFFSLRGSAETYG